MADYYSVLARAVVNLETDDGAAREELYERARYLAAIVAFSGVVYLRGLAAVYADIVQYPILLGAMAALGCLLIPLSRMVFRRLRGYSRSAIPAR